MFIIFIVCITISLHERNARNTPLGNIPDTFQSTPDVRRPLTINNRERFVRPRHEFAGGPVRMILSYLKSRKLTMMYVLFTIGHEIDNASEARRLGMRGCAAFRSVIYRDLSSALRAGEGLAGTG